MGLAPAHRAICMIHLAIILFSNSIISHDNTLSRKYHLEMVLLQDIFFPHKKMSLERIVSSGNNTLSKCMYCCLKYE